MLMAHCFWYLNLHYMLIVLVEIDHLLPDAAKPDFANELYEYIIEECKKQVRIVETGVFGADMKVGLVNDGPVTIILEKYVK